MFPLLILSKRMHSIFMLRCFNDCFAVLGMFAAIFCYQRDQWHIGSFLFATGLNVKMSLLLPLPAMGILFIQKLGSRETMTQGMIIFQTTVCAHDKNWILGLMHSDSVWLPIPESSFLVLWQGIRAQQSVPLQVDGELAIRA